MLELLAISRRIFTLLFQTDPRYFQVFLRRDIGPRYLSIPKILLCTLGILVFAPVVRFSLPPATYLPLLLLPFAPRLSFNLAETGQFTARGLDLLPFVLLAIAFLFTALRRHFEGAAQQIEGKPLHSFDQGTSRLFEQDTHPGAAKEPLLIFATGAVYAYTALYSGLFHPAFGSFLIVGAIDYAISYALRARHWSVAIRDQIDQEIRAARIEQLRERELAGRESQYASDRGAEPDEAVPFRRAGPGGGR
ncbi:MAG: hypothetical protein WEF50_10700 [Myxococcota bacterium]